VVIRPEIILKPFEPDPYNNGGGIA